MKTKRPLLDLPDSHGAGPLHVGFEFQESAELSRRELATIAALGVVRTFARSTIIASENNPTRCVYVLLSGTAKSFISGDNGKELLLELHGPGHCFGYLQMVDGGPSPASVITATQCTFSVVSADAYQQYLSRHPELLLAVLRVLAATTRSLMRRVKDLGLCDTYCRIASVLLGLAIESEGTLVVSQRLTQSELASMVGASREMVSRILGELRSSGYIDLHQQTITILKPLPSRW